MTSSVKRPNSVNYALQALLIISILGFVLATTWMFITSEVSGVYAYGSIAIYCLLNTVGIILIQRWHKVGVWFCLTACLVECSSLFIWRFPLSSSLTSSVNINYLPYIIIICAIIILVAPLFVLKAHPSGKIILSEMRNGLDVKHSRHIYQLTSALLVGVIITMWFYKPSVTVIEEPSFVCNNANKEAIQRLIDYTLLDSLDVTLNEIVSIESMIDSIPVDSQLVYNKRIFALKHILLSGLMTDKHNTLNLKNIYKIHMGEFSKEQQRVLDWYLALPQAEQEVWLDCPSVDNLLDFEKEVKQRTTTKSK